MRLSGKYFSLRLKKGQKRSFFIKKELMLGVISVDGLLKSNRMFNSFSFRAVCRLGLIGGAALGFSYSYSLRNARSGGRLSSRWRKVLFREEEAACNITFLPDNCRSFIIIKKV